MKDDMFDPVAVGRVVANLSQLHDMEKAQRQRLETYAGRLESLLGDIVGEIEMRCFHEWADNVVKDFNHEKTMFRSRMGIYGEGRSGVKG